MRVGVIEKKSNFFNGIFYVYTLERTKDTDQYISFQKIGVGEGMCGGWGVEGGISVGVGNFFKNQ